MLSAACHSQLGVRVVIEDYVHGRGMRTVALALVTYLHVLAAAAGVFAIIKVALGGAA
jgi:succinate dehydrogenase / fumarate reductase membrane anchor subunit